MKISNEKRKKLYNLINILEIRPKYEYCYINDCMESKDRKGLGVKFDLCMFKNLNIYIPNMSLIDEHLIKDYIIENLESIII
ncbi:hypothetical protein [Paraclostridium sordellii]|uniref:hypothetical protein n=1 Tax=Paraclostridium sordellii TaxID=1505 RepID=UPI0005E0810E|nr:hypothetical protein [Paeniclostridium sordellii]CEQ00319.1 Uncharacterised protein [[Clostridium] sordellii] [Paeniclostridium sordellii]